MKGIDKNIPAKPHTAAPSNTITNDTNALIFTLDDTMRGTRILLSINCMSR